MQALILAAGRGTRLGSKGAGVPKCLLEIARKPLIEHQLAALAAAGVGPVAMVLGYSADEVRERVGIQAEYLLNPEWSSTNSLYSFWLARDWVRGDVLVLNCDILFDPSLLDRLLAVDGNAIAFDSLSGEWREHMKVEVHQGFLRDMSKDLPKEKAAGENVGVLKLTATTSVALFATAGELLRNGQRGEWLGAAVRQVARECDIRAIDIAGLPWAEIDFPYDLDRARKEVWPLIENNIRRRRPWRRLARWTTVVGLLALAAAGILSSDLLVDAKAWSTLDLQGVDSVILQAGSRSQRWALLEMWNTAVAHVEGPGPLRIDSRLLLKDEEARAAYVLEVKLDGQRVDWFKFETRASRTARLGSRIAGKHRGIEIELPEGGHTVTVRFVASESVQGLVRMRALEPHLDEPEDDPED